MTEFRSDFLRLFAARGHYYQSTNAEALDALLQKERQSLYVGFDCTAPSLHVGHLSQIMALRRLQQAGHRPIVVMGGGTTKVGDPSWRDESRPLLSDEQIEANKKSILRAFERFLKFGNGPSDAIMVDNAEWLDTLE
jgi:tyrosyl-tRNA synthetase